MVKFCVIFIVLLVPSVSKYLQGTLCYLTLMEMGNVMCNDANITITIIIVKC